MKLFTLNEVNEDKNCIKVSNRNGYLYSVTMNGSDETLEIPTHIGTVNYVLTELLKKKVMTAEQLINLKIGLPYPLLIDISENEEDEIIDLLKKNNLFTRYTIKHSIEIKIGKRIESYLLCREFGIKNMTKFIKELENFVEILDITEKEETKESLETEAA